MLVVLFVATQALGLLVGKNILDSFGSQVPRMTQEEFWPTIIIFTFIFLLVSFVLLSLLKKVKSGKIFRFLFYLAIVFGLQIFFSVFVPSFWALLIAIVILIAQRFYARVWLHDIILVMSLAGIGASVGLSFLPKAVIIIMIVLSIWDLIAVFKTKQMVVMFRLLVQKGAPLALVIPINRKDFHNSIMKLEQEKYLFLGTGDLVLPLIFACSLLRESLWGSILVVMGATCGLLFLVVFQKIYAPKRPLPGLPPIVLFSLLGYLIYQLGVFMGY